MAPKPAAQEPLDKLQKQVDSVLLQLGKIFKHAHTGDSKALNQAKNKAKKGIPEAHDVFHEALEELEKDLMKARAFLITDLEKVREKRAAREKAAGAARLQANAANGAAAGKGRAVKKEPNTEDPSKDDVIMAGVGSVPKAGAGIVNGASGQTTAGAANAGASMPTDIDADLDSMFTDDFANDFGGNDNNNNNNNNAGNTAGQQAGAGNAHDSIDDLFGDGFDGSFGLQTGDGNDDINTLLPGIDKYSNRGQDGGNLANTAANNVGAEDLELDTILDGIINSGPTDTKPASEKAPPTQGGDKSKDESTKSANAGKDSSANGTAEAKKEEPVVDDFTAGGDDGMNFDNDLFMDGAGDYSASGSTYMDDYFLFGED